MRRRVIVSLGLLLALYLLGGAAAILCLDRTTGRLSELVQSHQIQSMRESLASGGLRMKSDLLAHIAGYERQPKQPVESQQQLSESLQRCGSCHHQPAVQAKLDGIRDTFRAYLSTANLLFAGDNERPLPELEREALKLADSLVRQTTDMSEVAGSHLVVKSADAASSARTARQVLLGTLGASLVVGGIVAFHLTRRLTTPVNALLEGIARIRQGDPTHRLEIDGDQEFRALATAFNQAYEDLRKAQESILHAEKLAAAGRLAAGVAHEVLNPIASISSIAQLMRRQCKSDEQAKQIDRIATHVARASRIVRELLSFSGPSGAKQCRPVDLKDLLEHATSLVEYDLRTRRITITRTYAPDLRPVHGDSDKLLLVFANVMINALDAISSTDDGRGILAITARQDGERVVVGFEDNGPGMTEEQMARAFEPFFTTKEPGAGTGLGLWISYQVIQEHDGTVRIDSRVGEGTTVTVELPSAPGGSC